jgi:DNA polymerase type B, organellar and viral.
MTLTPVIKEDHFPKRLLIPKLKQLSAPNKMVFLGVQTEKIQVDPTHYKRVMVRGCAIYWRRERAKVREKRERYTFSNTFDFFEWLTSRVNKRETVYVYSYDATTDFLSLDGFRQLPIQDFTLSSIYHKLTTTIMKFTNESRRLTFLDVQNYYPVKLSKLSSSFGVALDQTPANESDHMQGFEWSENKAKLLEVILKELLRETIESGRGALRMTASSTAHSIFRSSYMKHKIVTNHDPEVVRFEQSSYVGGYTGLSNLVVPGSPELYKVDVNSMYPSVMYDRKYPTQLIDFTGEISLNQLERYLNGHSVIANVALQAKNSYFPHKRQDGCYYPTGAFTATLASASLEKALQNDEITKVNQVAVYLAQPLFAEFVTDVYNRRIDAKQAGNTAVEMFQKAINNTLYGKFGQLQTETVRVGDAPLDEFSVMDAFHPETNTQWVEMHAGGSILFIRKKNETRYTSFAIASHITDYARQKLFSLREQAGIENVFYMDTDSLVVSKEGLHNLYPQIHQTHIGLLKLEDVGEFFVGFAKKDYIFSDTRKLKGFDLQGKRVDESLFTSYEKASFTGSMQKRFSGAAYWKQVNKYYNPFVSEGKVLKDGQVQAFNLPMDEDQLGMKVHTLSRVRELSRYMLSDTVRASLGEWLGV